MNCDICHSQDLSVYVDAKTCMGPWAYMCLTCHAVHGIGLGLGKGQIFRKPPKNGPLSPATEGK